MRDKKLSIGFAVLLAIFAGTTLMTATRAAAQSERVLHSFNYTFTSNEFFPAPSSLIVDADGNLYGTTYEGGPHNVNGGTVFKLTEMCGGWTAKVLHNFGSGTDGFNPSASLIFDAKGNLYGTTLNGGAHSQGTVFELSPAVEGGWTEKILHSFEESNGDGVLPQANLVFDAAGNLYGETTQGGTIGWGTVFELSPTVEGGWTEKILHSFGSLALDDGYQPSGGLIFDAEGNLYGTTQQGGNGHGGTVFELSPKADGGWTSGVLHHFGFAGGRPNAGGSTPESGVIFDAEGNLYGTTYQGGPGKSCGGCGVVFELTPPNPYTPPSPVVNTWTEKVLHYFDGTPSTPTDGQFPSDAGVIFDAHGSLYGTTSNGGGGNPGGTVFKLIPAEDGVWHETLLHRFGINKGDGASPVAGLIFDDTGTLYGTTVDGGVYNTGTVFEITP
jgi:uncharacterized repeat protein (TIGR03803 family)